MSRKISIITVVRNNRNYIGHCIDSVIKQNYNNIEYIVIDGGSTDGTVDIIKQYQKYISQWVSEPDHGIYDAMNKGINLASGDVVGILNSDDYYVSHCVIEQIMNEFDLSGLESVFADLVYVKRDNVNEIVRYYRSSMFHPKKFAFGWMPAHPTFFVKRNCYERYGLFKTDYKIAAN